LKKKKLYEGKTKKNFGTDNEAHLVMEFKDDVIVSDDGKKKSIKGKGEICNELSGYLFQYMESYHIQTHFMRTLSEREMLVKNLDMIPIEIVVRNIAADKLTKQFNVVEGKELECPITEFYLKEKESQDSMINIDHIVSFGHATSDEMYTIQRTASKINAILKDFFRRRRLRLVDVRLEFGRYKGKLLLGDELSPNTCRLWELSTGERYEDEHVLQAARGSAETYQELRDRILKSI